jgi:ABC-type thiamine transport system ATPase subunit
LTAAGSALAASVSAWRWPVCLVREQPVLLLDEPFSALDPALRQEMLALVKEVCQRQQLTLLMVSHNVEDAARIAPRALVIADGRIAWDGKQTNCSAATRLSPRCLGSGNHFLQNRQVDGH